MSGSLRQSLMVGDTFLVNTHAELLNEVFKTHYKAWYKSSWRYSRTAFAWLVHIDGKSRNNFSNIWLNKDTILQHYEGTDAIFYDAPDDSRLVFEIVNSCKKKYIFQGVFRRNSDNNGTSRDMTFERISDVFPIR